MRFSSSVSTIKGHTGVALIHQSGGAFQYQHPPYGHSFEPHGDSRNTHFFVAGFSATIVNAHVNKSGLSPSPSSPNFLTSIDISMLDLPTYDTNPESLKSQKWLRGEIIQILSTAAVTTVGSGPVCYWEGKVLVYPRALSRGCREMGWWNWERYLVRYHTRQRIQIL